MTYFVPQRSSSNTGAASSQSVSTPATPPVYNFTQLTGGQNGQNGAPGVSTGFNFNGAGPAINLANNAAQGGIAQAQGSVNNALNQVGYLLGVEWPQLTLPNFDISGLTAPDQIRAYVADYKTQLLDAIANYRTGIMGIVNGLRNPPAPTPADSSNTPNPGPEQSRSLTLEEVRNRRLRRQQ